MIIRHPHAHCIFTVHLKVLTLIMMTVKNSSRFYYIAVSEYIARCHILPAPAVTSLENTQHTSLPSAFRPTAAQFKRAVKIATGQELSENVLDTVFQIFDLDGDNCLSHEEFIAVMKDRMLRGLRVSHQTLTTSCIPFKVPCDPRLCDLYV